MYRQLYTSEHVCQNPLLAMFIFISPNVEIVYWVFINVYLYAKQSLYIQGAAKLDMFLIRLDVLKEA